MTVETAKHRSFLFLDQTILPDNMLIAIGIDDPWVLGVLSSCVHVSWALAAGGTLEDRPRYNKTRCFETFPFPDPAEPQKARIRQLAEDLDAHRKARQTLHPALTMTGLYNVLEKLRQGEPLGPKERQIHEQGLVSVLRQIHDELDASVLAAYRWDDLIPALLGSGASTAASAGVDGSDQAPALAVEESILQRLVALNAERVAEERRGLIRWLRPAFQNPGGQSEADIAVQTEARLTTATAAGPKTDWPKTLPDQIQALRAALAAGPGPQGAADIVQGFNRAPRARVAELLETLATLGHARRLNDGRYLPG